MPTWPISRSQPQPRLAVAHRLLGGAGLGYVALQTDAADRASARVAQHLAPFGDAAQRPVGKPPDTIFDRKRRAGIDETLGVGNHPAAVGGMNALVPLLKGFAPARLRQAVQRHQLIGVNRDASLEIALERTSVTDPQRLTQLGFAAGESVQRGPLVGHVDRHADADRVAVGVLSDREGAKRPDARRSVGDSDAIFAAVGQRSGFSAIAAFVRRQHALANFGIAVRDFGPGAQRRDLVASISGEPQKFRTDEADAPGVVVREHRQRRVLER